MGRKEEKESGKSSEVHELDVTEQKELAGKGTRSRGEEGEGTIFAVNTAAAGTEPLRKRKCYYCKIYQEKLPCLTIGNQRSIRTFTKLPLSK